jgi:hypothetical protein
MLEQEIEYFTETAKDADAYARKLADLTATWLVAGNAAGLLLIFNAVLDHKVCDWAAFQWPAVLLALGLAFAFLSVETTLFYMRRFYVFNIHAMLQASGAQTVLKTVEDEAAKVKAGQLPPDPLLAKRMNDATAQLVQIDKEIREGNKKFRDEGGRLFRGAAYLQFASVAALIAAVLLALFNPGSIAALCPAS